MINGDWGLGIGDWGLGIGDWGLGIGDLSIKKLLPLLPFFIFSLKMGCCFRDSSYICKSNPMR